MEGVYRLLLHERKLIQDDTSHTKRRVSMQYERDVCTALGTTKWQVCIVKLSIFNIFLIILIHISYVFRVIRPLLHLKF
jgi:hypothetical protein